MSAPSLNYAEVLDYFIASDMAKSKKLAAKASKQFVSEIGIAPRNMGEELTQSLFLEWFLFDYDGLILLCEPREALIMQGLWGGAGSLPYGDSRWCWRLYLMLSLLHP